MESRRRTNVGVLLVATLFTTAALAHHGLSGYDQSNLLHLEGKVVGFELKDPHSLLFVDVANADGSVTPWEIEGGAASGIVEAGLSREYLSSGPMVRVTAYRSRDTLCKPRCAASGQSFDFER